MVAVKVSRINIDSMRNYYSRAQTASLGSGHAVVKGSEFRTFFLKNDAAVVFETTRSCVRMTACDAYGAITHDCYAERSGA